MGMSGGSSGGTMADINVTPLVDVMLVLLIIFMITAPMMQGGVDVELPRAEARPLTPKEGMVVTVNRDGCQPLLASILHVVIALVLTGLNFAFQSQAHSSTR